jgi:hypothetical protein
MKAKGEPVPSGCEMGSCCKKSERNAEDVKSQFPAQLRPSLQTVCWLLGPSPFKKSEV